MDRCQRRGESARGSTPAILIQATVFDLAALVGGNRPPLPISSIPIMSNSSEMYLGNILKKIFCAAQISH